MPAESCDFDKYLVADLALGVVTRVAESLKHVVYELVVLKAFDLDGSDHLYKLRRQSSFFSLLVKHPLFSLLAFDQEVLLLLVLLLVHVEVVEEALL